MGSKSKYAKYIVPILQEAIENNNATTYIECFVGGANIIDKIKCENKYGYDRSDTLIALLDLASKDFDAVLKDGNRELWDKGKSYVKDGIMPEDMSLADIGAMEFFASFCNGGFPRGYAKNTTTRNYYQEAYRNAKE
jgi:DNA adenine methylase